YWYCRVHLMFYVSFVTRPLTFILSSLFVGVVECFLRTLPHSQMCLRDRLHIADIIGYFSTLISSKPAYCYSKDYIDMNLDSYISGLSIYLSGSLTGKPKEVGYFLWRKTYNIIDQLVLKIISNLFNEIDFYNIPDTYDLENEIENLFKEDIDEEDEEEIWFGQTF
ncbi:hypothetical protein ACU6T2_09130, partial [Avibacterium paragallinarum]|uniref:hypothetical protein n=1 Tax=Avibacterium paragallinarum TaxID=728 RepID=UPI00406CCA46